MTTPERLRARQIREGVVLILLAIFTVLQAVYFNLEDREQRDCFQENFVELNRALDVRSDLTARETALQHRIWKIYAEAAGIVKDDPTKPLPKKEQEQLQRDLVAALLAYDEGIQDITRERRQNPLPPYPAGTCE